MKKIYKTKGLDYYVTNCNSVDDAVKCFIKNRVGVTKNDLEEIFNDLLPVCSTIFVCD